VIDGQENPYTTAQTSKFYEIQKYVTEIHYMIWTGPLLISEKFYQDLPPDMQEAVSKAGLEAVEAGRTANAVQTEEAKAFLTEKGMVLSGAPKDEDAWREAARGIWPSLNASVGGEEWVKTATELMAEAAR